MEFGKNKNFKKQFLKLPAKTKIKFAERINILLEDPQSCILSNHKLKSEYNGYFSINITGDIRAIYKVIENEVYYFIAIGTHSELYE